MDIDCDDCDDCDDCGDCDNSYCWCSCKDNGKSICINPSVCLQKQYLCTPMMEPIQKAYSSFNFETLTLHDFFDFFLYISHFGKDECSYGKCVTWPSVYKFRKILKKDW